MRNQTQVDSGLLGVMLGSLIFYVLSIYQGIETNFEFLHMVGKEILMFDKSFLPDSSVFGTLVVAFLSGILVFSLTVRRETCQVKGDPINIKWN